VRANPSHRWISALRASGCRVTTARRAVVETVAPAERALTPTDVHRMARVQHPALGLVTVYRTLEKLEGLGLIQRVHQDGGCQAFISAGSGHQHMLLCEHCGKVIYFEGDDLEPLMTRVARQTGYAIQEHWLQLVGICQHCQEPNLNSRGA
jgi:Fur family ferric uptake transcriptional regulator